MSAKSGEGEVARVYVIRWKFPSLILAFCASALGHGERQLVPGRVPGTFTVRERLQLAMWL